MYDFFEQKVGPKPPKNHGNMSEFSNLDSPKVEQSETTTQSKCLNVNVKYLENSITVNVISRLL